jgi:hypothetical protein
MNCAAILPAVAGLFLSGAAIAADSDAGRQPGGTAMGLLGGSLADEPLTHATDLLGKSLFDSSDQRVGEIEDLLIGSDGTVRAAVVDIGGFLGVGERPVAIRWPQLEISQLEERIAVSATKDQLAALPRFHKSKQAASVPAGEDLLKPGAPIGPSVPGSPEQR